LKLVYGRIEGGGVPCWNRFCRTDEQQRRYAAMSKDNVVAFRTPEGVLVQYI